MDTAIQLPRNTVLDGRYVILDLIGYGRLGITYAGWDQVLEQQVAIKEYLPAGLCTRVPGQTPVTIFAGEYEKQYISGLEKFLNEAQRLAACRDVEHVVKVYGNLFANNTGYIVMELLEGKTLGRYLAERGGKLPYEEAAQIMLPVLDALEEVHKRGIIHRDISPDNIYMTSYGEIKLLDFGAARHATSGHSKSLTVMINQGYAPEEQYRSKGNQGPWTDVYAAAATLYRMITGTVPEDAMDRLAGDVLKSPLRLGVRLPKYADHAIMNALNVQIEHRTQSASEFKAALSGANIEARHKEHLEAPVSRKMPVWMKCLIGGSCAALVAAIAVSASFLTVSHIADRTSDTLNVPSLLNLTQEEAKAVLEEKHLILQVAGRQESQKVPKDTVILQNPGPGEAVKKDAPVEVMISRGPVVALVPDLEDRYYPYAAESAEKAGFQVVKVEEFNQDVPDGVVVSQSVESGSKFQKGGELRLVVSKWDGGMAAGKSGTMVTVPKLTGRSFQEAKQLLQNAGLYAVYSEQSDYSMTIPKNQVLNQSIPAGSKAAEGAVVEIMLSRGVEQTTVPTVDFIEKEEALGLLEEAKLDVVLKEAESLEIKEGYVISQSIEAGEIRDVGTEITIVVSLGHCENIPNVVSAKEEQARELLTRTGFIDVQTEGVWSDTIDKGVVMEQEPAEGVRINVLRSVKLTVSKGIEQVEVPDVTGMSKEKAASVLSDHKLSASFAEKKAPVKEIGQIVSQGTAPGTTVDKGTEISLSYSIGMSLPEVANLEKGEAVERMRAAGFSPTVSEVWSDTAAKGSVISQNPSPGKRLPSTAQIVLTVSKGVEQVVVPSVIGMSKTEAAQVLKRNQLSVEYVESVSQTTRIDEVTNQSLSAGSSVDKNSRIVITYSPGVSVPDVTGEQYADAKEILSSAGLSVSKTEEYNYKGYLEGMVIKQDKSEGLVVPKGSRIKLTVSKGEAEWSSWKDSLSSSIKESGYYIETRDVYRCRTVPVVSEWSDWKSERESGKKIAEEESQYRERTKEYTKDTVSSLDGWTDTGKSETEKGEWSDWSEEEPLAAEGLEIESKEDSEGIMQYRTRSVQKTHEFWRWTDWSEWKEGSRKSSGSDTESEIRYRYRYLDGTYGNWSKWQADEPEETDGIEVEYGTQYRYRPKK